MEAEKLKDIIIALLEDKKAEDISVIDLHNKTSLTRYMVFASGRSSKNVGAVADYVADELKKLGLPRINIEGLGKSEWVLLDAGDVLVHLFHPEAREYYKLEELWSSKSRN